MQKRFYILFVARGDDGQLRKISIPVHYLYVFVVGAAIGFLSLTGIASSYTRMLLKVSRYNQLRTEKDQLKNNYSRLEQVAKERDVQVASLGSIAGEVSALYGLKAQPTMVTKAGTGYSHILKGSRSEPHRRRKSITPTACPMNCTSRRIARMPAMAVSSFSDTLKIKASPPRTRSET